LTYDYHHIPFNKGKFTLHKKHYQDFLKRLRKVLPQRKIKYVICGEYGTKIGRPHYHLIIYDVTMLDYEIIKHCWGMGDIHLGTVTPASIAYTFKYSVKGDLKERDWRQAKSFVAMSKGLGLEFAFDVVGLRKSEGTSQYVNKQTGEVKERNWVRYAKIYEPKQHFKNKLDTLLQQPYYVIPNANGGVVKMSIPKIYLRVANYDTSQLGELFADVIAKKYTRMSDAKKEAIFARQQIQHKYAVIQQTKDRYYSVSKEKL
jgi:hypothetical protein